MAGAVGAWAGPVAAAPFPIPHLTVAAAELECSAVVSIHWQRPSAGTVARPGRTHFTGGWKDSGTAGGI